MRDSVSDEEAEEEQEDILIVEADEYPDQSSPEVKHKRTTEFSAQIT